MIEYNLDEATAIRKKIADVIFDHETKTSDIWEAAMKKESRRLNSPYNSIVGAAV